MYITGFGDYLEATTVDWTRKVELFTNMFSTYVALSFWGRPRRCPHYVPLQQLLRPAFLPKSDLSALPKQDYFSQRRLPDFLHVCEWHVRSFARVAWQLTVASFDNLDSRQLLVWSQYRCDTVLNVYVVYVEDWPAESRIPKVD